MNEMHPDDQPPANKPASKPKFPTLSLGILYGLTASMLIAVSGTQGYTVQWWAIVLSVSAFFVTLRIFLGKLVSYVAARSTLTITRNNDTSI